MTNINIKLVPIYLKSQILDSSIVAQYYNKNFKKDKSLIKIYKINIKFINLKNGVETILNKTKEEFLLICNAGSYGHSLSPILFTSHEKPKQKLFYLSFV